MILKIFKSPKKPTSVIGCLVKLENILKNGIESIFTFIFITFFTIIGKDKCNGCFIKLN